MLLLLFSLVVVVNADSKKLALIESFTLKSAGDTGIACPAVQQVYIESINPPPFLCTGDIKDAVKGMTIGVQAKPITRGNNSIKWVIVTAVGNLTSTVEVNDNMEEQQTAMNEIDFTPSDQPMTTSTPPHSTATTKTSNHIPTTAAHQTTVATSQADQTTAEQGTTPKAEAGPAKLQGTPTKVTVTVNYIQFQTGEVVQQVNKNSAAVVFAVLEGLILGAILVVFFMRRRAQAQLRAAMYPNPTDYQSNTNTVQYTNGMGYQNSQIPSYRSPDPPVRLDNLPPRTQQQPTASPTLMPVTTPPATSHITPAPLNYWPDQPGQGQPVKNIMDSDM